MIERISDKEYFSYKALNKSQIKQWNDANPMAFWKQCVFNPNKEPDKITDALVVGKLAHLLLLEPEKFKDEFEVIEPMRGMSSRNTQTFQKMIAENKSGKDIILSTEIEDWLNRVNVLKSYDLVKAILKGLIKEKPIIWAENGFKLKAKLDGVKNTPQGIVLVEYKTSSTMEQRTKGIDVAGYVYDVGMQAKAIKALYNKEPVQMLFIIQSQKPGEEHYIDIRAVEEQEIKTCVDYTNAVIKKIKARLDKGLKDESFKTELNIKPFEGYANTSFSWKFDKEFSEMGEY